MKKLILTFPLLLSPLKAATLSVSLYLSDRLGSSAMGLGGGVGITHISRSLDLNLSASGVRVEEYSTAYYRGPRMGAAPSGALPPEFLQLDLTLRHRGEGYSVGIHSLLNNDTLANVGLVPFAGVGIYRRNDYLEAGTSYSLYLGGSTLSALQVSVGWGRALRENLWLDLFTLVGQVVGVDALGLDNGTYPSLGANLRLYLPWGNLHFGGWYGRQLLALKGYGFVAYNLPFVYTDGLFTGVGMNIGNTYVAVDVSAEGYLEDGIRRTHAVGSVSVSLLR